MDFWQAIRSGFSKYANFSGRAPRSEFWFWTLFYCLAGIAASFVDRAIGLPVASGLFWLATLIPTLAVTVRRLHDLDRTGWWLLLFVVPAANFVLVVWWCMRGTSGYNRFGPDYFRPGGYARSDQPARRSFTASSRPNR
jgi:uncharacterized membrane protein YhaH (DUF805 family)